MGGGFVVFQGVHLRPPLDRTCTVRNLSVSAGASPFPIDRVPYQQLPPRVSWLVAAHDPHLQLSPLLPARALLSVCNLIAECDMWTPGQQR